MPSVSERANQEAAATSSSRRPIDLAWAGIIFLIPVFLGLLPRLGMVDLAYHLRAGAAILEEGIPRSDSYTFTVVGDSWLDQQWGAQALLRLVYDAGGFELLVVVRALLAGTAFAFVFLACRGRGASPRTSAILTILGFLVAVPTMALRPQLLALPLFAVALWSVATRGTHPRRVWLIPPLAFVTANVHGSFVLFPLVAGLAFLGDASRRDEGARRMLIVTVASLAATLVNPFGVEAWTYVHDLSTNTIVRDHISEWSPVTLPNVIGVFVFGSVLAVVGVIARRGEPTRWIDLLWLGVFLVMALAAIRAIVWWTLVAPVVLAGFWPEPEEVAEDRPKGGAGPAFVMVATLLVVIAVFLPWWRPGGVQLADAPPGVTEVVTGLPEGSRIFVHQPWASWLEFASPQHPVFADSRIEIFPREIWEDYSQVAFSGAGWRMVLERWDPDVVVADSGWDIVPYLEDDPGWRLVHEDNDGLVFVRT